MVGLGPGARDLMTPAVQRGHWNRRRGYSGPRNLCAHGGPSAPGRGTSSI